jgi:hypothetical protein
VNTTFSAFSQRLSTGTAFDAALDSRFVVRPESSRNKTEKKIKIGWVS